MSRFFVVDFDRTLCDTSFVVRQLELFLDGVMPHVATALRQERAEVERSGGSYDVIATLKFHVEDTRRLLDDFIETYADTEAYLLPNARALLDALQAERYGIMTYGGREWQQYKLRLARLDKSPSLIISEKGKGVRIASWHEGGGYRLPEEFGGGVVDRIILIDDKASEFSGLPQDGSAQGYWVVGAPLLPSQDGEVSHYVNRVTSLQDVMAYETLS